MTMPDGELINAQLRAMGDVVPDVEDHPTALDLGGMADPRGVVDELPGGLGGDGGTPG